MNIRAKLRCTAVQAPYANSPDQQVTLEAVTDSSPENKTFSKWTPAASVSMLISNPDAHGAFEPGKEYYLDFTEATPPAPTEPT